MPTEAEQIDFLGSFFLWIQGSEAGKKIFKELGQEHLLFVRCTCILLQCGNVVVADALLGRFLPRLGPLVVTQAASFLSAWSRMRVETPRSRSGFPHPALDHYGFGPIRSKLMNVIDSEL